MKTALITGVTGQDGSYLAELLLQKGYRVVGVVRRSSTENFERIAHLRDQITLAQADLLDQYSLTEVVKNAEPDEVYNLAAMSFVPTSWSQPVLTGEFTALGVTRILEAVRWVNPKIRFYQASSSEMYGKVRETPQTENTPFYPRSPYGVAKVYGHYITVNYRESYNLFAVSGILFNHESPRRGLEFVTRKATNAVARIKLVWRRSCAWATWTPAGIGASQGDYVEAMRVHAPAGRTGRLRGIDGRHALRKGTGRRACLFEHAGLDWQPVRRPETPAFYRPAEVDLLVGDPAKAKNGWAGRRT